MPRRPRVKPSQPRRPFYDEEGYDKTNPYLDRVLERYPERLIHPTQALARKGHWREWSEGRPIHVEIGPGKGRFITEYALAHPEAAVIGIEIRFQRFYRVSKRLHEAGAFNGYMMRFDANYLDFIFAPGELDHVFLQFPDPWAGKNRHRYLKMLDDTFAAKLHHLLAPGGVFEVKTDHQERFGEYVKTMQNSAFDLVCHTRDLVHSDIAHDNIETIFEEKFRERGLPACYLKAVKP